MECRTYGAADTAVLILAGIHGDEPAGTVLTRRLCAHLAQCPEAAAGTKVVVVPEANPDGLAAGRRTNARGVDLNRNFATRNWRPHPRHGPHRLSEPESRFLAMLIGLYRPAVIVTIHQPLGCVDYDGPARDLAEAMARACGLPARKLGARPGSLGSYAGLERQVPTITLELPRRAGLLAPDALWARYGEALLTAVRAGREAAAAAK